MSTQQKQKKFVMTAIMIGIIAAGVTGTYFVSAQTTVIMIPITQEEQKRNDALGVAQKYIVTSPTFAFDGDINTLDTVYVDSVESIPSQYVIKISFDSSHGGFGNREGQMLIQAITPHTMTILVSEGNVISAVTDETWDELNHQYVLKQQSKLPSSNYSPQFDGKVIDSQSLVSAIKSRGLAVEQIEKIDDSAFEVPIQVISVGGMDLQVYEFDSESDVSIAKEIVSSDGTEIGLSVIRWMDAPHFYSQGKIIVQYIGHNPEMLNLLDSFLGNQFAGM
jgi:hypothetical protein